MTKKIQRGRVEIFRSCEKNVTECIGEDKAIGLIHKELIKNNWPFSVSEESRWTKQMYDVASVMSPRMIKQLPMKEKYQIVETICGNLNPNKSSRSKGVFVNYEDIKEQKKVTLHVMRNVLLHALDACKAGSMSGSDSFLACTAIRSKNLLSCNKDDVESCAPTLDEKASYKERSRARDPEQLHMNCVWQTALKALMGTENFDKEKATSAMKASWNYCYNDLKPLGRRYIDWEEGE